MFFFRILFFIKTKRPKQNQRCLFLNLEFFNKKPKHLYITCYIHLYN